MKSNYYIRRVNSPFDDSGVFVRNVYMKKAVLFDCGRLGNIENSELNDISYVFISHTHIDHFNGFDRFLRTSLLSGNTFTFFGPDGFINNVKGKLSSYTWNLIRDYDVIFKAVELGRKGIRAALFSAKNGFEEEVCSIDKIVLDDGFLLQYEFFDHGITSIGYRLKEPERISFNKDKMAKYGLKHGIWAKDLKEAVVNKSDNDLLEVDTVSGKKKYYINELKDMVVEYPAAQDITYITDIAPSYENYKKAVALAKNSFLLLIEAVFMGNDIIHSIEKNHLSIGLAKEIYRQSDSEYVSFGHFAPKYDRCRDIFFKELYDDLDLSRLVKNELIR